MFSRLKLLPNEIHAFSSQLSLFFLEAGDILSVNYLRYEISRYFQLPRVYKLNLPALRSRTLVSKVPFSPELYNIEKTDFSLMKSVKTDPTVKKMHGSHLVATLS